MHWNWGNLQGMIPLLGGIYVFLLARGILPRTPQDPERMALWRRKFGTLMSICAPIMILLGILQLLGVL